MNGLWTSQCFHMILLAPMVQFTSHLKIPKNYVAQIVKIVYASRIPPRPLGDWKLGSSDAKRIGRAAGIDDPVACYFEVLISPQTLPNRPWNPSKSTPKSPKMRPRCAQEAPKRPKSAQETPKSAQGTLKRCPRGAQERPRGVREANMSSKTVPKRRSKCEKNDVKNEVVFLLVFLSLRPHFEYLFWRFCKWKTHRNNKNVVSSKSLKIVIFLRKKMIFSRFQALSV